MRVIVFWIFLGAIACSGSAFDLQPDSMSPVAKEDFDHGMSRWWVEGGERTWARDGRLHMKADPEVGDAGQVATAWFKQELPSDVRVAVSAHVISSSQRVNNVNVFLSYADPSGIPLYDTRDDRASASYALYHQLNGYIFTFLVDTKEETLAIAENERPARVRIRRSPGFELLAETYGYNNRAGQTYRIEIVKCGGKLSFSVDGNEMLSVDDPKPHAGGLLGLRTYRTYLRWSDLSVFDLTTRGTSELRCDS